MTGAVREVEADKGTLDNAYVQLAFTVNAPVPASVVPPAAASPAFQQRVQGAGPARALRPRPSTRRAGGEVPGVCDPRLRRRAGDAPPSDEVGLQGVAQTGNALPGGHTTDELLQGTLTWTVFDQGLQYADKHSRSAWADIAGLEPEEAHRSQRRCAGGTQRRRAPRVGAGGISHGGGLHELRSAGHGGDDDPLSAGAGEGHRAHRPPTIRGSRRRSAFRARSSRWRRPTWACVEALGARAARDGAEMRLPRAVVVVSLVVAGLVPATGCSKTGVRTPA